ncbi:MAG: hypothetical protein ACLQDM_08680 [Bradyrhizobium sp.]
MSDQDDWDFADADDAKAEIRAVLVSLLRWHIAAHGPTHPIQMSPNWDERAALAG